MQQVIWRYQDVWGRAQLGLAYIDTGRAEDAAAQLRDLSLLVPAGQDWKGLEGGFRLVEAGIAELRGEVAEANRLYAETIEIRQRFPSPFEEAEANLGWGRALARAGEAGADEKFEAAAGLYEKCGVGPFWAQRVDRLRQAAG